MDAFLITNASISCHNAFYSHSYIRLFVLEICTSLPHIPDLALQNCLVNHLDPIMTALTRRIPVS